MVSVKADYKDLQYQRILSGNITRVTKKDLGDKTRDKNVEVQVNIVKLDVDVGQ